MSEQSTPTPPPVTRGEAATSRITSSILQTLPQIPKLCDFAASPDWELDEIALASDTWQGLFDSCALLQALCYRVQYKLNAAVRAAKDAASVAGTN